jgi:hypothetical protein
MRKLIIASLLLLATSVRTFAGPIIGIHFEIGRKSLDCQKFGICNGGIDASWKLSTAQLVDETGALQIFFSKESILGKEEYFSGNTLTFEEEFTFSADIQKALGSRTQITIKPGKYQLVRTKQGFQVNIPLN